MTSQEVQALYDEYERLNGIYLAIKSELVEEAIDESENTVSFRAACKAYRVYTEARKARIIARNKEIYYGKKK